MRKFVNFAIFLSALYLPLVAWGYSYTEDFARGIYWKSFPVSLRVAVSDAAERDRLEGMLLVAMDQWQTDQPVVVWEIDYGESSKNILRWSDNFQAETGYPEASTLGVTIRHFRGTYFEKTEIILNSKIKDLVANKGNLLAQTIGHELAHTVGVGHTDQSALMYPIIGAYNLPHADDLEALTAVVKETIRRQDTGYVAPGSQISSDQNPLGCGGTGSSDAGSLDQRFALSLLLGTFPFLLFASLRRLIGKLLPGSKLRK